MALYALTIFLGAFLLFQVQPLIGKFILPWFGGGPGIWTTCMLFFQVLLLGGYAYAHFTTRWLKPRAQKLVHLILLVGAVALLPINPGSSWKPGPEANPMFQILGLLTACLGVPYLVLSTTGPLVQQWFAQAYPGKSPYRLYALSNLGSLLALLSYPFFFETHFTRKAQSVLWGWGLVVYVICCGMCLLKSKVQSPKSKVQTPSSFVPLSGTTEEKRAQVSTAAYSLTHWLLWLALPACASMLLLATTNKLCQDVAVVPFLWVAPLALYLLSFIICFDSPRWYAPFPYGLALIGALGAIAWALCRGVDLALWKQIVAYSAGLFICCMACHGELYRLRPEPARLTSFYLMVAAGGALGGIFVAVLAPRLFNDYYELHYGLLLCGLLFIFLRAGEGRPSFVPPSGTSEAKVLSVGGEDEVEVQTPKSRIGHPASRFTFHVSRLASFLARIAHPGPLSRRMRLEICACLVLCWIALAVVLFRQARDAAAGAVSQTRNFYGVLTVYEHRKDDPQDHYFLLQHGRISHGMQFADKEMAKWATSYYGPESGLAFGINALPAGPRRIGIIGLGTGSIAVYGRPGDAFHIYEINPQVKDLATSRFTYVRDCQAKIEIVPGDARLSMEREPPQGLDMLVLDAFSGDAIPVHLLTEEAFEQYNRHLKPAGIIAVHVSNRYLDLEPVVVNVANRFHYNLAPIDFEEDEDEWWLYACTWILLSRDDKVFRSEPIHTAVYMAKADPRVRIWTDDFASLFSILR